MTIEELQELLELLKWMFLIFAVFGAYEGSKRDCNKRKMNILYTITNIFSVIYFFIFLNLGYLCLYLVFLSISVTGIIRNGEYI